MKISLRQIWVKAYRQAIRTINRHARAAAAVFRHQMKRAIPTSVTSSVLFRAPRHCWLPLLLLMLAGCASTPPTELPSDHAADREQIRHCLTQVFDAAEKADFARLDGYHAYGPHFTKFAADGASRQDAARTRQSEHEGLLAAKELSMQADDLQIDVFGKVGIATFVLKYHFRTDTGRLTKKVRSTLVFVREHGEWRITHEHLSADTSPP